MTKAPPEFPGLIEASVCIKFSYASMPKPDLPRALTIPDVTVCPIPKGLPIATTKSPTLNFSESEKNMIFANTAKSFYNI